MELNSNEPQVKTKGLLHSRSKNIDIKYQKSFLFASQRKTALEAEHPKNFKTTVKLEPLSQFA